MVNIFEKLQNLTKTINNPNKNYWESEPIDWDKTAKSPDGNTFNEREMYESIRQSDIKRLLKFG